MRSRMNEIRAAHALRRAANALHDHAFFCAQLDKHVHTLRAKVSK
jgi:hypothetical protein